MQDLTTGLQFNGKVFTSDIVKEPEEAALINKLALEIENILSDAVGDFIAQATIKKNCELIGTTPDALTEDMLPDLADKIDKSVSFFSGMDVGSSLAEKIRSLKT